MTVKERNSLLKQISNLKSKPHLSIDERFDLERMEREYKSELMQIGKKQ